MEVQGRGGGGIVTFGVFYIYWKHYTNILTDFGQIIMLIAHCGHNTKTNSIFIIFISMAAMSCMNNYDNNINISNYL